MDEWTNKSPQATRDGRSSSASRFTRFGPACLSSGRQATPHTTQTNKKMKTTTEQSINIATIIALFLIAMSTSPKAITQLIVFIALLAVVFGRDLLLKKQSIVS